MGDQAVRMVAAHRALCRGAEREGRGGATGGLEPQRGQWRGGIPGGRAMPSLVERDEDGVRRAAVVEVPAERPVTPGVTVEGQAARFWHLRAGVRTTVWPVLDFSRLSDDHGSRLPFTGRWRGSMPGTSWTRRSRRTSPGFGWPARPAEGLFGVSKVLTGVWR
ncbi:hypothetical protein ACH4MW_19325 [Streptomyces luteogriseus]|uniref:hypothetical protein n=1 Tax=Streptomyces luteogriseus TaxID=68233 RepID=UPI0037A063EF